MRYRHTDRPGFLLGFIDFFTAGLFFLVYMQLGLQEELESVLGHKVMPYRKAYLLGIPTLFIYGIDAIGSIIDGLRIRFVKEHSFTPAALVKELTPIERMFFKLLFTGKLYRKIYRMYELKA